MSGDERDRQLDIFQAAYADIPIRDQRDMMERPFFAWPSGRARSRSSTAWAA